MFKSNFHLSNCNFFTLNSRALSPIFRSPSHNSEVAWLSLGPMAPAQSRCLHKSRATLCAPGARSKGKGKRRVGRGGCTPKSDASMELHRAREVLWRELSREMALNHIRVTMPPTLVQEQKLMIKQIHRVLREESSHRVVIKWIMILIENQVADRLFLSC